MRGSSCSRDGKLRASCKSLFDHSRYTSLDQGGAFTLHRVEVNFSGRNEQVIRPNDR